MSESYKRQAGTISGASEEVRFPDVKRFNNIGLDVVGTISAGNIALEGTNNNSEWFALDASPITAVGHVRGDMLGFSIVRAIASGDFDGDVVLSALFRA